MPILKEFDFTSFFYHHSYEESPQDNMFVLHTHNVYEIFVLIKGDCNYEIEGTVYNISPFDILIMRPFELHKLTSNSNKPFERIVMQFNEDLLKDHNFSSELLNCFNLRNLGQNNLISAKNTITKNIMDSFNFLESHLSTDSAVAVLVKLLIIFNDIKDTAPHTFEKNLVNNPQVQKVILYINEHITEDINLDDIANYLFMNKFHLNRTFKKAVGSNIYEYIIKKRLSLARHFIKTGYTPNNACKACGYGNYSAFYRSYVKEFNKSPKEDMK